MRTIQLPPQYDNMLIYLKNEIRADVKKGILPDYLENFSQAHDYVDANEYFIDMAEVYGLDTNEDVWILNRLSRELDRWIQKGGLERET